MLTEEMDGDLSYERVDGETRFVMSIMRANEVLARQPEFVEDARADHPGDQRFGGVAASFAGNGQKGNGRGAEGSNTLATGSSRSDR